MMLTPAEKAWEELLHEVSKPVPRRDIAHGKILAYLRVLSVVPTRHSYESDKILFSAHKAVARIER